MIHNSIIVSVSDSRATKPRNDMIGNSTRKSFPVVLIHHIYSIPRGSNENSYVSTIRVSVEGRNNGVMRWSISRRERPVCWYPRRRWRYIISNCSDKSNALFWVVRSNRNITMSNTIFGFSPMVRIPRISLKSKVGIFISSTIIPEKRVKLGILYAEIARVRQCPNSCLKVWI